jgi:hypothetical protein
MAIPEGRSKSPLFSDLEIAQTAKGNLDSIAEWVHFTALARSSSPILSRAE